MKKKQKIRKMKKTKTEEENRKETIEQMKEGFKARGLKGDLSLNEMIDLLKELKEKKK